MKYRVNVNVERRFDDNLNRIDDAGNPLAPLIKTDFAFGKSITLDFTQAVTAEELKSVVLDKLNDPSLAEVRLLAKSIELPDAEPVTDREVMLVAMIGLSAEHEVAAPAPTNGRSGQRAERIRPTTGTEPEAPKPAYDKATKLAAIAKFKELFMGSQANKITNG